MKKARGKRKKGRKRVIRTDGEIINTRKLNYIDIIDIPKDDFFGLWYHELQTPLKNIPIFVFIFRTKEQAQEAHRLLKQGSLGDESDDAKSKVSFKKLSDGGYLCKLKALAGTIETYAPQAYVERFLFCLAKSYLYVVTTGYPKGGYPKGRKPPELLEPALFKRTVIVDGEIYIGEEVD